MKRSSQGEQLTEIVLDIFKLHGLLITEGDKLAEEFSLTSARWKVLGALSSDSNALTVADIARNMGLTRQAVQRLSNEMQADGLLESKENPNHKRAKLIALTTKGMKAFQQLDKKQIEWINIKADGLDISDLNKVSSVMKTLIQAMGN